MGFPGADLAQRKSALDKLPIWIEDGSALQKFPNQHVFRDKSGNIVVVYKPESDQSGSQAPRVIRYPLPNRVAPAISTIFQMGDNNLVKYQYRVTNQTGAEQPITAWYLIGPSKNAVVRSDSGGWSAGATKTTFGVQVALPYLANGSYLSWMVRQQGITPGSAEGGFEIWSPYLPGITTAHVRGAGTFRVPDELPLDVSDQLAPIDNLAVSSFITIAVGPRFDPGASRNEIVSGFRQDLVFLSEHSPQALGDAEGAKQLTAVIDKCLSTDRGPCSIAQPQGRGVLSDIARAIQFDLEKPNQGSR